MGTVRTKTIACACECGCGRQFTWELHVIKKEGGVCWWCRRGIHLGPPKKRKKKGRRL